MMTIRPIVTEMKKNVAIARITSLPFRSTPSWGLGRRGWNVISRFSSTCSESSHLGRRTVSFPLPPESLKSYSTSRELLLQDCTGSNVVLSSIIFACSLSYFYSISTSKFHANRPIESFVSHVCWFSEYGCRAEEPYLVGAWFPVFSYCYSSEFTEA